MKKTVMRLDTVDGEPYRDEDYNYVFVCENCGMNVLGLPRYCPGCGCEVDVIVSDKPPDA